MEREGALMGLFGTLVEPTEPMSKEAVSAGFYESPFDKSFCIRLTKYQVYQIVKEKKEKA